MTETRADRAERTAKEAERAQRLADLQDKLASWLREQHEVTEVDDLGDGIFGVRLATGDAVSVVFQFTQ